MEKSEDRLANIKSRWRVGHFLNEWRRLPEDDRDEVIAWLEDQTRTFSASAQDRRLYRSLLTVLDVLDSIESRSTLGIWEIADDIDFLVEEADRQKSRARPLHRRTRGGRNRPRR